MNRRTLKSKRRYTGASVLILMIGIMAFATGCSLRGFVYSQLPEFDILDGKDIPQKMTVEGWRADLQYLAQEMPKRFIRFYDFVPREEFEAAIAEFSQKLPTLTRNQIELELMKLIAMPKASHTTIVPFQPAIDWHFYPLLTFMFSDGVYITDAPREYRHTIGKRIVSVAGKSIEQIYLDAKPFLSADNEMSRQGMFPDRFLPFPEVLRAQGYIEGRGTGLYPLDDRYYLKTRFRLEDDTGRQFSIDIKPMYPFSLGGIWFIYQKTGKSVEKERSPVIAHARKSNYWFEFWADSQTIYFQFNSVRNQNGESIAEFSKRLENFVNTREFDRLIVDIRNNGGGDSTKLGPLVELLSQNQKINQWGKLFAVISRRTGSAAVRFAAMLQNRTKTIFAGEPTGGSPNTAGDTAPFILPNSKIVVYLSYRYFQDSIADTPEPWISPDLPVAYTHHDFFSGRDPIVESILAYQPEAVEEITLAESQLVRYTGQYLFRPNQILTVQKDDGRLVFTITDFETFAESDLYPISETRLLTDIPGVELHLSTDEQNLVFYSNGKERVLPQVSHDFMTPIALIKAGKLDEGIETFRKNDTAKPQVDTRFEVALIEIGATASRSDQHQEAIKILELLVELFPLSVQGYNVLGDAFRRSGALDLAKGSYEYALSINPSSNGAKARLQELASLEKDSRKLSESGYSNGD